MEIRRQGVEHQIEVERGEKTVDEFAHPALEVLDHGVYVDLSPSSMTEISAAMETLSHASRVVLIEAERLGAIVGGTTAGTNGDRAEIAAPSGCRIDFTSMRVTKHDGTQLHLIGIQPTHPVVPTIAGVAAGRDEVRDRAVRYVRTGE